MNWHSPAEFFAMGGYALYVWASVLACAVAPLIEVVLLRARRRAALAMLRQRGEVLVIEREERARRVQLRVRREAA